MSDENTRTVNSQENNATTVIDDTEMGDIRIHEGVIASLARRATLMVEGISRLAGNSLVDNIAEFVGSRRMQSRNININLDEDNNVDIEIKVVLKFGVQIPKVATEVQKAVIDEVESTTGMNVTNVHVLIQDIEESAPAGNSEDTGSAPADQ